MKGRPEKADDDSLDTPEMTAGAIQYLDCPFCGVKVGDHCRTGTRETGQGSPIFEFAHISRRMAYNESNYPAPTLVLQTWEDWRDKQRGYGPGPSVVVQEEIHELDDLIGKVQHSLDDLIGVK